jgi:hypothetical protein
MIDANCRRKIFIPAFMGKKNNRASGFTSCPMVPVIRFLRARQNDIKLSVEKQGFFVHGTVAAGDRNFFLSAYAEILSVIPGKRAGTGSA